MKHHSSKVKPIVNNRFVIFMIAVAVIAGLPLLACAFARSSPSVNITIVNNSNLEFRHVYLSPVDRDTWGPDQLNGSVISPGSSYTLSNVSCEGSSIKVIAEDQNGCFLYQVVSCAENTTWTVTNAASPDCGN
jgi:hypothetical protein